MAHKLKIFENPFRYVRGDMNLVVVAKSGENRPMEVCLNKYRLRTKKLRLCLSRHEPQFCLDFADSTQNYLNVVAVDMTLCMSTEFSADR